MPKLPYSFTNRQLLFSRFRRIRRPRAVRRSGAHAKRPGADRPAQLGVPVFREPTPDGHSRITRVMRPLHRRLPFRLDTGFLFGRFEVRIQANRLQREQVAHCRRRVEPDIVQLQRDHSHRVSRPGITILLPITYGQSLGPLTKYFRGPRVQNFQ